MATTLLTGATGHIGRALLPELLQGAEQRVVALIRARDATHLVERRARLVERAGLDASQATRLLAVAGDVAAPGLGLRGRDLQLVDSEVDRVLHSAASVRFDLPDDTASAQNIEGATQALALSQRLAERGRLVRHDHISTAFVAGDTRGPWKESDLDRGQGFRNSYEWSKCQAEKVIRLALEGGLPGAVHRPSIVVGDSRSGATDSFNVLYWPVKIYARGWWRTFPGSPATTVDVVPVDYVARAIAALVATEESLGGTFHHAVGAGAPTARALEARVRSATGGPPVRYVDQDRWVRWIRPLLKPFLSLTRRGRAIRRGGDAFLPYFRANPMFDTTQRDRLLPDLPPPPVLDYFDQVLRYAVARDFGRLPAPSASPGRPPLAG